ncbi:DUF2292 domain-containing protein [Candidatus Gottesmanbacteria bacterium]|nr:DUF2292 domain-containing protein [Candidatus Gottesmanbacteria bacterium]
MQSDSNIKLSQSLIDELTHALHMIKGYGSIEIYVQDSTVTQITVRNIKKTKVNIDSSYSNGKTTRFIPR